MRAIAWQKSSFSNEAAACLELAVIDHALGVRESDFPDTVLTTTPHRLRALLHSVRNGTLNRP